MTPLYRKTYSAATLASQYPPVWKHPNKLTAFEFACPPDIRHEGSVTVSRWSSMPLPAEATSADPAVKLRPDFFTYESPPTGEFHWHLNFANYNLFSSYAGALFAQDEMQVLEHPLLASVRQALLADKLSTLVVDNMQPVPILISGVPRRMRFATEANAAELRPGGLYGRAFASAPVAALRRAVKRIDPPTASNILAIEAPVGGYGPYTTVTLRFILETAYTGFRAALLETADLAGASRAVIHTGFWGCGAYGGNRTIMTMLQLLAARLARVPSLVFHSGDEAGNESFTTAAGIYAGLKATSVESLLTEMERMGYSWGTSDGN